MKSRLRRLLWGGTNGIGGSSTKTLRFRGRGKSNNSASSDDSCTVDDNDSVFTKSTFIVPSSSGSSNGSEDGMLEAEVSSTSSGVASHDGLSSSDNSPGIGRGEEFAGTESYYDHWSSCYSSPDEDPYADVRDRMEMLSARDRARFAYRGRPAPNLMQPCGEGYEVVVDHQQGTGVVTRAASDTGFAAGECAEKELRIPPLLAPVVYFVYGMLICFGHMWDFLAYIFGGSYLRWLSPPPGDGDDGAEIGDRDETKFAPLLASWEHFYTRRLYTRIQDCFNRPIASNPGAHITVLERVSADGLGSMQLLGPLKTDETNKTKVGYIKHLSGLLSKRQRKDYEGEQFIASHDGCVSRRCLNLGSYNYLGFADDWQETCSRDVKKALESFPVSMSSARGEYGTTSLHRQVEMIVAKFVGKEDALCYNMGFNTNATTIPALVGRDDLLISDELNHTSIVNGARASGAAIRIFRHNDTSHLEQILRDAIIMGKPKTRRPWNKILVVVEGIYSMEGEYCDLNNIVRLCKRYGAYVYLDEAHSIGAMGATGRGCAEYAGVNTTADIDIMMGTFTKSFGGMGGYVAADKATIAYLRKQCAASAQHNSLSPIVCQQVISAFKVIMGQDGTDTGKRKLQALRDNSNYFRMRLRDMGLQVLGQYDSPVMPVMLYQPSKIGAFSRECLKRRLAAVVVGFPAVPLLLSRARFCISAGHTRDDLDRALDGIDEIANVLKLRYNKSKFG